MIHVRGAKASTLNCYMAGIRQLHIGKGCELPKLRSETITQMLRGKANKEAAEKRMGEKEERMPITPDILLLIKAKLGK